MNYLLGKTFSRNLIGCVLILFSFAVSPLYANKKEHQKDEKKKETQVARPQKDEAVKVPVITAHKKVLFIVPWMLVGGMDRSFLSLTNNIFIPPQDIDVCILQRGGPFEKFLRKEIRLLTLEEAAHVSYDVVVSYAQWIDPCSWAKKIHAKKRVQWIHTDLLACDWWSAVLARDKINSIDTFVCVSEAALKGFQKIHPDLASKACTIATIIDTSQVIKESQEEIKDMPEKDPLLRVVTVARLGPEKGIDRAINVHKRLNKEGYSFRWYVVGGGDEKAKLEQLIKTSGLEGKFILLGEKMNPYPYLRRADIFALLSRYEGFGLVVSEAKSLRRPIIVTNFTGAKEQIVSGKNGLIVDNTDEAIYQGMKRMLADAEMRKTFRENLQGFKFDNSAALKALHEILTAEE